MWGRGGRGGKRKEKRKTKKRERDEPYLELPQRVVALLLARGLLGAHGDELVDAVCDGTVCAERRKREGGREREGLRERDREREPEREIEGEREIE